MKKTEINKLVFLLLVFCSACGATAQSETSRVMQQQETTATATRGAASVDELAEKLFVSIQGANIGMMEQYFLSEEEIATLKEKSTPQMKAVLENLSADQISGRFREDYNQLIEQSIPRRINWAEVNLTETIARKETNKGQALFPVELDLRDRANQQFKVVFEAIQLDGRYFLFRQIAFA